MCPKLSLLQGRAGQFFFVVALSARQLATCDFSTIANDGDTCQTFTAVWGLSLTDFEALNPGVRCPTLIVGQSYCVAGTVSSPTPTSPTTTSSASPATTTSTTITKSLTTLTTTTTSSAFPYEPTQPGFASKCNNFYLVSSGDTCSKLESQFGISAADFGSWNPFINQRMTFRSAFLFRPQLPSSVANHSHTDQSRTTRNRI